MAAPNPLPPNLQFTDSDWKELVANSHPGGGNAFSRRSADACLVGMVPFAKVRGFARYALGWSYVNVGSSSATLQRTPPIAHPIYTNLYCTSFTEVPFVLGDEDEDGEPAGTAFGSPYASSEEGYNPTLRGYGLYRKSRVVCKFAPLPYDLTKDEEMEASGLGEEFRWTEIDVGPKTDILSVDGQQLTFVEGNTPPFGNKVPGSVGQVLVKSDVRVTWYGVPKRWLFGATEKPTKILAGLGTVNDAEFYSNYPAGTLMCSAVTMQKSIWPFAVTSGAVIESQFEYDVQFLFSYFSPTRGPDANLTLPGGWNLQPWRGLGNYAAGAGNSSTASGYWYTCTFNGNIPLGNNTGGQTLFRTSDFSQMFTYALAAP